MRISDWSSDVCSSDLTGARKVREELRSKGERHRGQWSGEAERILRRAYTGAVKRGGASRSAMACWTWGRGVVGQVGVMTRTWGCCMECGAVGKVGKGRGGVRMELGGGMPASEGRVKRRSA